MQGAKASVPGAAVKDAQAKLLDTIPNVIAINWHPEGGENQLAAVVENVVRRLPTSGNGAASVRQAPRQGAVRV